MPAESTRIQSPLAVLRDVVLRAGRTRVSAPRTSRRRSTRALVGVCLGGLLGLSVLACEDSSAPPPPPPPPPECPAGQHAEGPRCAWDLPEAGCAPHTHARVGEAECHPIGAGACVAPFEADGAWGCREVAPAACPDGEAAFLGERVCRPVLSAACARGFVRQGYACRAVYAAACAGASKPTLGQEACGAVGDCGAPAAEADLYVDARFTAAEVDATHFTTVSAAVMAAREGDRIDVAPGRYGESVRVPRAVVLRGRCAGQTSIDGGVAVEVAGAAVSLSGLTLRGGGPGLIVRRGAQVRAEALIVERTKGLGVLVSGAGSALELVGSLVRDVRSADDGTDGRGMMVTDGGAALLRDVAVSRTRDVGIIAVGEASRATLDGVIVQDTTVSGEGLGGHALVAAAGGRIDGARVVAVGTADVGVLAFRAPSVVALDGLDVSRTGLGGVGVGVRADEGGAVVLRGVAIVEPTAVGLMVDDATSTASVSDVSVAAVRPDPATGYAAGIAGFAGARVHVARAALEGVSVGISSADGAELHAEGVYVVGRAGSIGAYAQAASLWLHRSTLREHPAGGVVSREGASVQVEDTLVYGASGGGLTDEPSSGLYVEGATLTVARSAVVGGAGFGLLSTGVSARLRVSTTLVRGQTSTARVVGQGILSEGGRLEVESVHLADIDGLGILALGSTELARTTIRGVTASRRQNGAALALGGQVIVRDVAVLDSQLAGVVLGAGRIDVDGLLVAGTRPNDQDEFGHAFLGEGTHLRATHVELRGSAAAGLAMDASSARITRSLVVGNVVGAHAQGGSVLVERADPAAEPPELEVVLGSDVLLLDNVSRVGVGTIPLPDPFALERR